MKSMVAGEVSYEEAINPIRRAVAELYKLTRTRKKSCEYDGYELHCSVACSSPQPDYQLSEEGLRYHKERGRKPIDVLLMLAFQLGYSSAKTDADKEIDFYQRAISLADDKLTLKKV